ncbi:MAG: hypothetical protein ABI618_07750, partial [Nitrospirota bacterium]
FEPFEKSQDRLRELVRPLQGRVRPLMRPDGAKPDTTEHHIDTRVGESAIKAFIPNSFKGEVIYSV